MNVYINWLLNECTSKDAKLEEIINSEATAYLSEKLITPLQAIFYLNKCFEIGDIIYAHYLNFKTNVLEKAKVVA